MLVGLAGGAWFLGRPAAPGVTPDPEAVRLVTLAGFGSN
jgi:hypothetical protein